MHALRAQYTPSARFTLPALFTRLTTLLLSALLLFGCATTNTPPYTIDEQATAHAPWKVGEIIFKEKLIINDEEYVRKFLGITTQGHYIVQEYYTSNNAKLSDPFTVIKPEGMHQTYLATAPYINGKIVAWYPNGQKMAEEHYQNGKLHGIASSWYEDGQKDTKADYQDGQIQGLTTWWYENGQKQMQAYYENGQKHGLATWWYENGQKQTEGNYHDGQIQGLWTWWNEDGNKTAQTWYENGIKVERQECQ